MKNAIRPRRLFVSGGSRLSPNAAVLWTELGRLLAEEDGLVVITGGLLGRTDGPPAPTADRSVVDGMLSVLRARGIPPEERIETVLPDEKKDWSKLQRFNEGRVRMLDQRTPQSRRFSLVHSGDVAVTIEGEKGVRSVLDLALALDRPTLPIPFGGGVSQEFWKDQYEEICRRFRISLDESKSFNQIDLAKVPPSEIPALAKRVHACLMRGFAQACFVIMRFSTETDPVFDRAIWPALDAHGIQPWRTDRLVTTGNVVDAIRDGLRHCHFAIADTTGDRPNVIYELGLAHALEKSTILLRQQSPDGIMPAVPFDFQGESIIPYSNDLDHLRQRLEGAIAIVCGKSR